MYIELFEFLFGFERRDVLRLKDVYDGGVFELFFIVLDFLFGLADELVLAHL